MSPDTTDHTDAVEALSRCRDRIDEIDRRLVELLNERTTIVEEIGRVKKEAKLAIYEPKRESQVFDNITSNNAGPLSGDGVKRIFERIIDEMRRVQKDRMIEATPTSGAGATRTYSDPDSGPASGGAGATCTSPDRPEPSAQTSPDGPEPSARTSPDRPESSARTSADRLTATAWTSVDRSGSSAQTSADQHEPSVPTSPDRWYESSARTSPDRPEPSAQISPDRPESSTRKSPITPSVSAGKDLKD